MILYTKTYYKDTILKEIKIEKFPIVIFTDSHTNLSNIKKLKELYPNNQIICLGDFTFLFAKPGEKFNSYSIQYLIDNNIPCLQGNHESIIQDNDDISCEQTTFLKNLPRGFKLIRPDGKYYLLYHNKPEDIWGQDNDDLTQEQFLNTYKLVNDNCLGVLRGHYHRSFIINYKNCPLITIGRLSKYNEYLLLYEDNFKLCKLT